jgi:hypothetical protein
MKKSVEGFVKVHRLWGVVCTDIYRIYPKRGEDLLSPLFKEFNRKRVRVTVECLEKAKGDTDERRDDMDSVREGHD